MYFLGRFRGICGCIIANRCAAAPDDVKAQACAATCSGGNEVVGFAAWM